MTDETPDSGSVATDPAPADAAAPRRARGGRARARRRRSRSGSGRTSSATSSPLITPIVVVVGLVVYVLNISRVFLSAHGHTSVVVGSVITVVILLGATVLSNSSRLRSQTIALMTAGFLLVVFSSGWLVLGHSQVKGGNNAAAGRRRARTTGTITITAGAGGELTFAPASLTVKTGVYS